MKKLLYLFSFSVLVFSCKKDAQEDQPKANLSTLATTHAENDSIVPIDSSKIPKKKPGGISILGTPELDAELYELNGINFYIQTKDAFFGNNTFQSQGKGKEIVLKPYSANNNNQLFYLRFLPASTGIPYLIYSTQEQLPIGAGSYASNPSKYVLYTQAANSTSLYGFSWDFAANTTKDAYYFINQDLLGSGGGSPWDIFNYCLDYTNAVISFVRPSNSVNQQFTIVPNDIFRLESIQYINDGTATLAQIPDFVTNWSYTNGTSVQQSITTSFGQKASKTSSFQNQSTFSTKITATVKAGIPFVANGEISTEVSASLQHTYGESETTEDTRNYDIPLLVPAMTRVTASATVTRYNLNVKYIATLRGINTNKIIHVNGTWSGVDCTDIIVSTTQTNLRTAAVTKGVTVKVNKD